MASFAPCARTVIIVDDDDALREAITFSLESHGFNVRACATGEDLLALRLPACGGCLLVDYHLGGITGLDALESLRHGGVDLPAIVITSAPTPAMRARAAACRAQVIEKPLLDDALFQAVQAIIGPLAESQPGVILSTA